MKKLTVITAIACSVVAQSASAVIIYSNDFNSESLGTVGALGAGVEEFGDVGGTGSYADIVAANGNFGSQHLELASRSDNGNYGFAFFDGGAITDPGWASVTTFKFDFVINSDFANTSQFRVRPRDTAATGGAGDVARGTDLDPGEVTYDTVHTIEFVVNNSSASATAPLVGGTIASGTHAAYMDGSSTAIWSGSNYTSADDLAVDYLTLWLRGDTTEGAVAQATLSIDNFEVHAIPEPATLGLVAVFGGAVLFIRRRFMI